MTKPELNIENDYQHKIMTQSFAQPFTLATKADVQAWRSTWMQGLSSWHSPYKLVVDCTHLSTEDQPEVREALDLMMKFFKGFHLRKAVGFGYQKEQRHDLLPFDVLPSAEEAYIAIGLRQAPNRQPGDFRSQIQIQNHFRTHVVEINFAEPVLIDAPEKVATLKSKLTNNLMQWHSKWSLLIDCGHLEVDPATHAEFEKAFRSLRGFFMKDVIGYSPKGAKDSYPFPVYRARHRAAAILEGEGNISGDDANCRSRPSS